MDGGEAEPRSRSTGDSEAREGAGTQRSRQNGQPCPPGIETMARPQRLRLGPQSCRRLGIPPSTTCQDPAQGCPEGHWMWGCPPRGPSQAREGHLRLARRTSSLLPCPGPLPAGGGGGLPSAAAPSHLPPPRKATGVPLVATGFQLGAGGGPGQAAPCPNLHASQGEAGSRGPRAGRGCQDPARAFCRPLPTSRAPPGPLWVHLRLLVTGLPGSVPGGPG